MDEKTIQARIKGERERCIANIAARTELPKQQWWLSFADQNGFRGCVITHANEFTEALTDATLHNCNPGGECRGLPIPPHKVVPLEWTYRTLSRAEAEELGKLLE